MDTSLRRSASFFLITAVLHAAELSADQSGSLQATAAWMILADSGHKEVDGVATQCLSARPGDIDERDGVC
jgi:hypothetical protein